MKIIAVLLALTIIPFLSRSQTPDKIANEAFLITRMVNKFHVEPRNVDDAFSANVFTGMLAKTDEERTFFINSDIARLGVYRTHIDDEIKQRKTNYLALFTGIYQQRLKQADSLITEISKKPIDFNIPGKLSLAEDTTYPASVAAMQAKLYKKIKAETLDELLDDLPGNIKTFPQAKQQKYIDSSLAVLQKKVEASSKRRIAFILQNPKGITAYLSNIYCETIASCFDPHTEFFPPKEKESFENALGKQPFLFGFSVKADKNGGVLIENLQPGSPAYKSGKLNKGDKFISLQSEGRKTVDVSDATVHELTAVFDENGRQPVLFTMKKADGTTIQVTLQKELAIGDDDKVKSFVLKGANTIGYIYLPAFYEDWDNNSQGINGCANDVGREIIKLKKEGINGLILDVRYNGGGSVHEATELAGIFIDVGPVAQEKSRGEKVITLKDVDRGTIYDGPLAILVNGYTASAAELLAGTLQDYNRAVIIGSPTYGKATMQVVLPMDTTVTEENFGQKTTENYLKVTVGRLFRVNGTSAQFKGVQPDIALPDILDAYISKEADEPLALRPTTIPPNKYYTPYSPLPLQGLVQSVQPLIDTGKYFNAVKKMIAYAKQQKANKDVPLDLKSVLVQNESLKLAEDSTLTQNPPSKKFTVQNNAYETARLQADKTLSELNTAFSKQVAADAAINIAYEVLFKLKSQ